MKKRFYTLLVIAAFSLVSVTACSNSPEETKSEASTTKKALTESDSSHKEEATSQNTSLNEENTTSYQDTTTENLTSSEKTSSIEDETTSSTTEKETTTSSNNKGNGSSNSNNSGSNNNSSNNNSSNNSSSNNSGSNNNSSNNNGNVVADKNSDKIVESYGGSATSEAKKLAQAVVDKIITKNMSDFEKAKAIHDYMVVNIDYDYDNYLANTIPNASYNVIGALKNKYAVCAGYAKTFDLLCELAGLECTYVTGTAGGPHAWNQVKIDGKWYNVDVTWDDPVSTDKAFDDHKYNRYSYFLISDELMYKDHTAKSSVQTCSSSLHTKAYEVGAPWLSDISPRVTDEASLSAAVKKAIDANSSQISISWDTNWISISDMSKKIKGIMLEFVTHNYGIEKYSYVRIPNTTICSCTFYTNLSNGKYTPVKKLCTKEDIKNLIKTIKDADYDQTNYPMASELVNDDIFYEIAVWAYDSLDVTVHISESSIEVNSTTKYVHVFVGENNYHGSHYNNEAYCIKSVADIEGLLKELHTTPYSFRVIYRYGDEIGRLSADEAENYVKNNLAPAWASKYCYENYKVSFDDFVCVMSITFYNPCHSSSGEKWQYSKEPTCIESGTSILKCGKCKNIIQSHEVDPTGVHDTYWVYENEATRHLACKNCTYTGPSLHNYGDVWGYYDNNAASELFTAANKNRENALHYNIDDFGNLISIETPPQLIYDSSLSSELNNVVLQAAGALLNGSGWNFDYNIAIVSGTSTVDMACSALTTASSHHRELFNNKYLTKAGVCCFYFDKDGTGLKLTPIWCIYYAE